MTINFKSSTRFYLQKTRFDKTIDPLKTKQIAARTKFISYFFPEIFIKWVV